MFDDIAFSSLGAVLRGRHYRSSGSDPRALLVMTHGFSATITMTVDRYAEVFRQAGFDVLLYDNPGLGISDGPRQEINPWRQACSYRDAIAFAATQPRLEHLPLVLWGDSLSGAVCLVVAGTTQRVAAAIAQVPATGDERPPADPDGALYAAMIETLESGDVDGGPDDAVGPMPVVSADQLSTPSFLTPIQAYRWFIEYGGRFGTGWQNRATVVVPRSAPPFHAGLAAPRVRCPTLMLVAPDDEIADADPDVARAVHDALAGPKELIEIDGGHFGLLHHPSALFDLAGAAQVDFLADTLS